jgi:glutathione S-transferase
MALTIYGSPYSRTLRVLWAAAELGVSYEHVPLSFDDPALKQADFLRISPSGAIPAIVPWICGRRRSLHRRER